MRTSTRNSAYGSAIVSASGYGLELDLILTADGGAIFGGTPDSGARGVWSAAYRSAPMGWADTGEVASSALVNGY